MRQHIKLLGWTLLIVNVIVFSWIGTWPNWFLSILGLLLIIATFRNK